MQASLRVREVLARLEETRWKYYNLHPASGEILALLARVSRAQQVIEVGTSNGYSSIILGSAVQPHGGTVTTIERHAGVAEEARTNIAAAGLEDVVTVVSGSAYKILRDLPGPRSSAARTAAPDRTATPAEVRPPSPRLRGTPASPSFSLNEHTASSEGGWDFAFLDATKQEYVGYLDRILPKLTSPALLVADNLLSHEDELAEFRERVAADPRLDATILPIGTGLLVGVYEQPAAEPAQAERAAVLNEVLAGARLPVLSR